ncbi:MAG TPA: hypothetical protein VGK25_06880 [Ignavibacteria bacterium]|jgi:hypothetical protein
MFNGPATYIDLILFLWVGVAFLTAFLARLRGGNLFKWLLAGLLFGPLGLIYVALFMKREKIKFDVPHKDPAERKLWYYQLKEEYQKSKQGTDVSGESKI